MKISALLCVVTGLSFVGGVQAEPSAGSTSAPTSEPSSAYTDQGTSSVDVSRYYSTPSSLYNTGFDSYYGGFSPGMASVHSRVTVYHRPIYFPPLPPALGEPRFAQRVRDSLAKLAPPAALAEDVYEPFYAPLSQLLFTEDLSKKRRERLDAYHASRRSLLTEIYARLESLQNADPLARETSLADLAREQAPRLAALESMTEEIRDNLIKGGWFETNVYGDLSRDWRLGDDTRWETQIDEIKVMRTAAAFQEGLSLAQRRLLREIEMELQDGLNSPVDEIALSAPGPFFYFSPETARIRLPAEMPVELVAKIEAYKAEKASLKRELRSLLYEQDRAFFGFNRRSAIKTLAEKQAGRFVVVEQLAEEIRRGLALLPNPARPPGLALPADLIPRLGAYNRQKTMLQTALVTRLDEIKNALPDDRVEFTRVSDAFIIEVVPNRRTNPALVEKRQEIIAGLVAFNREQTRLYSTLAREKEALRIEVLESFKNLSGPKSIDQLLREFTYSLKLQEVWELYRDYEIAALEPGLSPAQRIILFGAALEKLDLPLSN